VTGARAAPRETRGFGVPDTIDPHHVVVTIPRGRDGRVRITEQFGLRAGTDGLPESIDRVELDRGKWSAIAEEVRRHFNERLKEKNLPSSRWVVGDNQVERLLGRELCVLAWAIECASADLVPVALHNWSGLRPEERWWLYTATAAATGTLADGDVGWRKALRYALTENPTDATKLRSRARRRPVGTSELLPLFEKEKAG